MFKIVLDWGYYINSRAGEQDNILAGECLGGYGL